jgi:hypothetical protein
MLKRVIRDQQTDIDSHNQGPAPPEGVIPSAEELSRKPALLIHSMCEVLPSVTMEAQKICQSYLGKTILIMDEDYAGSRIQYTQLIVIVNPGCVWRATLRAGSTSELSCPRPIYLPFRLSWNHVCDTLQPSTTLSV